MNEHKYGSWLVLLQEYCSLKKNLQQFFRIRGEFTLLNVYSVRKNPLSNNFCENIYTVMNAPIRDKISHRKILFMIHVQKLNYIFIARFSRNLKWTNFHQLNLFFVRRAIECGYSSTIYTIYIYIDRVSSVLINLQSLDEIDWIDFYVSKILYRLVKRLS